jgi:hypothetical protein
MIPKLEHACYRCIHYRNYDGDYCQFWGEDTIPDPKINKYIGCHEFKGTSFDDEIYSLIDDVGKIIGKEVFISIVKERIPDTLKVCGDICKGSPGMCEKCHEG